MAVLVVIDMQKDFIDGSLGTKEAVSIVPAVKSKINEYRSKGNEIIFTRDTHQKNYLETLEGKKLPVVHCIENTEGWQISKELDTKNCKIINKPTFGSVELADYISSLKTDAIELVGLCTDICVISNALLLKAKMPEIEIIVDSKCCAGVTPESHLNALNAMKMCHITVL